MVKEVDVQVQEAQGVPNKLDPKRTIPRHIIIKMPKIKDKERILKAEREENYLQMSSHKTVGFFKRYFAGKKGLARSIQSHEKQEPTT